MSDTGHYHRSPAGQKFEDVWTKLLSDDSTLSRYANAMSSLATAYWEENGGPEASRIKWCVEVCREYCDEDQGALHRLLSKGLRRRKHDMPTSIPRALLPSSAQEMADILARWSGGAVLRLLDVGSCYNPFLAHKQFEVTAIDIAPAMEVRCLRSKFMPAREWSSSFCRVF